MTLSLRLRAVTLLRPAGLLEHFVSCVDHYLATEDEAYSSALPPHEARVPNIPSDGAGVCPAIGRQTKTGAER